MPNEAKHSALPWRVVWEKLRRDEIDVVQVVAANNVPLAKFDLLDGDNPNDAAFIVRACNAFEGLVEAAERYQKAQFHLWMSTKGEKQDRDAVAAASEADVALTLALAAAKGEVGG